MKLKEKLTIFALLVIVLLLPSNASARNLFDDEVVFGESFTLRSGESIDGSLFILGGSVTLEDGSVVDGDVVLLGGTLDVEGLVGGDVVGIGGSIRLEEHSVVEGDLTTVGASLARESGSTVQGQVITEVDFPFRFAIPEGINIPNVNIPGFGYRYSPFVDGVWFFFRIFMWAGLAVLLVMFFPKQSDRVSKAVITQPLITGGAGLLTAVLAPFVLLALTITIILIPVTLVVALLLVITWVFGWIAMGLEVGRRISKLLNQEWAPAIAAGVGMLVLRFVLSGFSEIIPCIGWLPSTLVGLWGLGAVLLTRYGTQSYPAEDVSRTKPVQMQGSVIDEIPAWDEGETATESNEAEITEDETVVELAEVAEDETVVELPTVEIPNDTFISDAPSNVEEDPQKEEENSEKD